MTDTTKEWDERDTQKTSYVWHRRKKIKLEEENPEEEESPYTLKHPFYRLLNNTEPQDCVEQRWKNFQNGWSSEKESIEDLLKKANATVVGDILAFIQEDWDNSPDAKVPTAIVLPGFNIANHLRLFAHIYKAIESHEVLHTARLSSKECPNLKSALRSIVAQVAEGRKGFSSVDSVVIKEEESTGVESDEDLKGEEDEENEAGSGIEQEIFDQQERDPVAEMGAGLDDDSEELQFDKRLRYDLDILIDWYRRHSRSVDTRVVVSIDDTDSFDVSILVDLIKMLSSYITELPIKLIMSVSTTLAVFQGKLPRYSIRLLKGTAFRAEMSNGFEKILDATLFKNPPFMMGPRVLRSLANRQKESLESIDTAAASLHYLYMSHFFSNPFSTITLTEGVDAKLFTENHLLALRMLPSFKKYIERLVQSGSNYEAKALLTDSITLIKAVEDSVGLFQDYADHVFELLNIMHAYLGEKVSKSDLYEYLISGQVDQLVETIENGGPRSSSSKKAFAESVSVSSSRYNGAFQDFGNTEKLLISIVTESAAQSYRAFLFHEFFIFDNVALLENVFCPTSRPAIELALSEPRHYWGDGRATPHISTLYQMYREASTYINIYDYYISFKDAASTVDKSDKLDEEEWKRKSLAWFLQGIAELQLLGILRDCKRKFECVEKVAWKGL